MGRPKKYQGNEIWKRNCPVCNKELIYSQKSSRDDAERKNRKCGSCGNWSSGYTKETNNKINKMAKKVSNKMKNKHLIAWNKGLTKETNDIIKKNANNHTGYKHTKESIKKISQSTIERQNDKNFMNFFNRRVEEGIIKNNGREKWYNTMVALGYFTPTELLPDFYKYKRMVRRYTLKNNLTELKNYNKRGRLEIPGSYNLDHKFSIKAGFDNNIPPYIIGNISNLEFITSIDNQKKKIKCSITKQQLYEGVF